MVFFPGVEEVKSEFLWQRRRAKHSAHFGFKMMIILVIVLSTTRFYSKSFDSMN